MNEPTEEYKYRGLDELFAWFVAAAVCGLLWGHWKGNWDSAIGSMIGIGLVALTKFIKLRRMTPEQFAAYQNKEKCDNDERAELISLKSCRVALTAMLIAASAAFVCLNLFCDNLLATGAVLGLLLLGVAALLIARFFYDKKL